MKKYVKIFAKHPLIAGSSVVFIGSIFSNLLNFLFNLFMVRNLTVTDYGVLASLLSLMTLFSLPAVALSPTIVRFGAMYFSRNELDKIRGLYIKLFLFTFLLGSVIFVFFLLFSNQIGDFFKIQDKFLIVIAGFIVAFGYVGIINTSLLQAKLAFTFSAISNIIGSSLKLMLGVILVFLGFNVIGGLFGYISAFLASFLLSFIPLKFIFHKEFKIPHISNMQLLFYGVPAALSLFGLTSLINTDIILVKHFFTPQLAGTYAGLSIIGKVIYFFSAPIATVMFPLLVQKHERKEKYQNTFILAILLVIIPSIMLTTFYFLFPEFIITFFSKKEYLSVMPELGIFTIYISVYSLVSLLTYFFLSIKKTKIFLLIITTAFLQFVGISLYHKNFLQVISVSLFCSSLLLFSLLLYYFYLWHKEKRKK